MGGPSDLEHDVFISYAHIDDEALVPGEKGWVTNFHHALEVRLKQILGYPPKVWRDARLQGNDYFADTLVKTFSRVKLLVPIVSPRYVQSDWCAKELAGFAQADQSRAGHAGGKSRIFKVVKTHVEVGQQPEPLRGLLGYEFFGIDPATQRPREFRQDVSGGRDHRYWDNLEDLVYDVAGALKAFDSGAHENNTQTGDPQGQDAIYLAPTSVDAREAYDIIKREFHQRGYTVLPDQALPTYGPELESQVSDYLDRCRVSVHLLGEHYGVVPEAAERSIIELQNEYAARRSEQGELSRLIWMRTGAQPRDGRQEAFIRSLQSDPAAQLGMVDFLQTDLDVLKTSVLDLLSSTRGAGANGQGDGRPLEIYLLHSDEDVDAVAPLEDYLFDLGHEVVTPLFEGDDAEIAADHQQRLDSSDAVILFYANGPEAWFRARVREVQNATGPAAQLVFLAGPETPRKQRFRTHRSTIVRQFGDFEPAGLDELVEVLNRAREPDAADAGV